MLVLEIEWLLGVCFAARSPADPTPDWPPQPDRVFSALTASWGARGSRPEERAALEWLECQAPPAIETVACKERAGATAYVPPNDAAASDIRILPERRRRQPRQFPAVVLDGEAGAAHLRLTWKETASPDRFAALSALARDTSYVGHSSSLVRCLFLDQTPDGHAGLEAETTTAAPYPGRLRELERLHARHGTKADANARPRSEPLIPPRSPAPRTASQSVFGTRWVVLEFMSGERPDLRAAAIVGQRMRDALMSAWPEPIPEWLSGHRPDGAPSREPHLAVLPLGDVGFRHSATARQSWHGLALVLPRAEEAVWLGAEMPEAYENRRTLRAALDRLSEGSATDGGISLRLGRFGALSLRPVSAPDASELQSLRPGRYLQACRVWSTVTPIALDRHTRREHAREEATEIIAESCTRIGLPVPHSVRVHKHAAVAGAPSAWPPGGAPRWTGWARPNSLAGRQLTHATLCFEDDVKGPVILGAGRFFGLGLCLPIVERPRR